MGLRPRATAYLLITPCRESVGIRGGRAFPREALPQPHPLVNGEWLERDSIAETATAREPPDGIDEEGLEGKRVNDGLADDGADEVNEGEVRRGYRAAEGPPSFARDLAANEEVLECLDLVREAEDAGGEELSGKRAAVAVLATWMPGLVE